MMAGPKCGCLVCRLEASLASDLGSEASRDEFLSFAASCPELSAFPTALKFIEHLHGLQEQPQNASSDRLLLELLARSDEPVFAPTAQKLFLLAFVPALHRTMTQIALSFPSLPREDTAQHLFTTLLQFLRAKDLRSRRSHLAFTIARKLRRSAFRWAIRESRASAENDSNLHPAALPEADGTREEGHSEILLRQFLDSCEKRGWLSPEERELLIQFKLVQMSGRDLGARSGHSPVAVRHRVHRVLGRLRRVAQDSGTSRPEQMDLFLR